MVSRQLRVRVQEILALINAQHEEKYDLTENVLPDGQTYIIKEYLDSFLAIPEADKERLINGMFGGWQSWGGRKGFDDKQVRSFARLLIGVALLLCRTHRSELEHQNLPDAADIICRASRWFHTLGWGWPAFRQYVDPLIEAGPGNIEDLCRMPTVCKGASVGEPLRTRPELQFRWAEEVEDTDELAGLFASEPIR